MPAASAVLAGAAMVLMRAVTSLDGSRVDRIGALQGCAGPSLGKCHPGSLGRKDLLILSSIVSGQTDISSKRHAVIGDRVALGRRRSRPVRRRRNRPYLAGPWR